MKIRIAFFLLVFNVISRLGATEPSAVKHGRLTKLRTCFDVSSYRIALKLDTLSQTIVGSNEIGMFIQSTCTMIQLDFNAMMRIDQVVENGQQLKFRHDSGQVYVQLPKTYKKGSYLRLKVGFSGKPRVAKNPPWDGGFVWSHDSSGYAWVGLACEGIGPSVWLPCKDHWSDEADSMDMYLTVPKPLIGVSNGVLVEELPAESGYSTTHWQVRSSINTYSININAARYSLLTDTLDGYQKPSGQLMLRYYVLMGNEQKASLHFKQVKPMLECYARYFGDYPFGRDEYKLVETAYWGMEHQSCVAYGNNYKNNAFGFDFIIIHESAHEWFANSITASDPADMWIHESFTTYAEALFVEYSRGYAASVKYLQMQRPKIAGKEAMVGPYGEYYHGWKDNDIYYKGTWMLHTMRHIMGNDSAWFGLLKGFYQEFAGKIISTKNVIQYFNRQSGRNWDMFFNQYLFQGKLPELEYKLIHDTEGNLVVQYRWKDVLRGFELPIQVTATKGKWEVITPRRSWQLLDLNYFEESDFKIKTESILMNTKKLEK